MFHEFITHFLILIAEIVVAVGEAESTLEDVHDDLVGILWVGAWTSMEEATEAVAVEVTQQLTQFCLVGQGIHFFKIGQEFAVAARVDGDGVHACIVEVADLLCHTALDGIGVFRDLVDDVLDEDLVALVDLGERTIRGVFLRNRVVLQPVVVTITEEVLRRIDAGVHVTQLDGGNIVILRFGCFDCLLSAACCQCG